jgi:4'-phosphopantetheinyl transferase
VPSTSAAPVTALPAPEDTALEHIGVWLVDLDDWAASSFEPATLTNSDHRQAERLRDPSSGHRLLARRSATRTLLGRVLGERAPDLDIARHCPTCGSTEHGRPFVVGAPIEFSVSSSEGLAVLALSRYAVGVDIEFDRGVPAQWGSLSRAERAGLHDLTPEDRPAAFLRLWTAKEAVVKAAARSLDDDLASVDVRGLLTGDTAVVDGDRQWHVRQLPVELEASAPVVLAVADAFGAPMELRWFAEQASRSDRGAQDYSAPKKGAPKENTPPSAATSQ